MKNIDPLVGTLYEPPVGPLQYISSEKGGSWGSVCSTGTIYICIIQKRKKENYHEKKITVTFFQIRKINLIQFIKINFQK